MHIGDAITRARERAGVTTQTALAAAAGINQTALSRYESGRSDVPDEARERIESALGMKRGQLLIDAGLLDPDLVGGRTPDDALVDVSALPERGQEMVRGFVAGLRELLSPEFLSHPADEDPASKREDKTRGRRRAT